uniref:Ig-like domain-containing protein n=1 Tax=Pogona vitticeps TaxID=103695 RepID=A0ABM5FCN6_9SAUR
MFPYLTGIWILQLVFTGFLAAGVQTPIKGKVGQNITLPCHYSTNQHGITTICWGQGKCPYSFCSKTIVHTDAQLKIHGTSSRYLLLGDIQQGDVSLTIVNTTEKDSGIYCCRVEISGWFNDKKTNVEVVIKKGNSETTSSAAPVSSTPALIDFSESYFILEPRWMPSTASQPDNVSFYFSTRMKHERKEEPSWTSLFVGCGVCAVLLIIVTLLLLKWYLHKKQKMNNATSFYEFLVIMSTDAQLLSSDRTVFLFSLVIMPEKLWCMTQNTISQPIKQNKIDVSTGTISQNVVRGVMGQAVLLPCWYNVQQAGGLTHMCWGRGSCPNSKCSQEILRTDGRWVVSRSSSRYDLKAGVTNGDVSLTITNLNERDGGLYCCRIEIRGWFNDIKKTLNLQVERATTTVPTTTITTSTTTTATTTTTTTATTTQMVSTIITTAPFPTTVTHSTSSFPLLTTNPHSPKTPTATSGPTTATSSISKAISFPATTLPLVNTETLSTTLQDKSTKSVCPFFTTEMASSATVATSSQTGLSVSEMTEDLENSANSAPAVTFLDLSKKYYPVLIACILVLGGLFVMAIIQLVKCKKMRKYQLDNMKSLIKEEEPEQSSAETERESVIFPL